MEQGHYVRHRVRPDWGIGQVLLRTEDRIEVQFAHGLVALKLAIAAPLMERVSTAEASAAGVATTTRRTGPARTASGARRAPKKAKPVEPEPEPEVEESEDEHDE